MHLRHFCWVALFALAPSAAVAAEAKIDSAVDQLRVERDALKAELLKQHDENDKLRSKLPHSTGSSHESQSDSARATNASFQDRIAQLEAAIAEGVAAGNKLRDQITSLQAEKQELRNAQTALTSGLIGALVTTVVAVAGALSTFRRSRVDRDYRRLEVIAKAQALAQLGSTVPVDIVSRYFGGDSTRKDTRGQPAGHEADHRKGRMMACRGTLRLNAYLVHGRGKSLCLRQLFRARRKALKERSPVCIQLESFG